MPQVPDREEHPSLQAAYRALLGLLPLLQSAASWAGDEAMAAARSLHLLVEQSGAG